jgi:uncharacterized protein (UPF0333 family)
MYAELYDKFLKLENTTIEIVRLIGIQADIMERMKTEYNLNNDIQTRINYDIIIIFITILGSILCLFSKIK